MRVLSSLESHQVFGGEKITLEYGGAYSNFMLGATFGAGMTAGVVCALPVAAGMLAYGVLYYGVYTPIYYVASGIGAACGAVFGYKEEYRQ